MTSQICDIHWERYPTLAQSAWAKTWLKIQRDLGLAQNTIEAYGRALEDYLLFNLRQGFPSEKSIKKEHIAAYVRDLSIRPNPKGTHGLVLDSGSGLSNATMQQRLTAVRLYYDFLMEDGIRSDNPVGRGRYTPGKAFGGARERGLIPHYTKLPWIPNDEQWRRVLEAALSESLRNRVMFALAYDAALRREELCSLSTNDIDPAHRLIHIRAETTKNRRERVVPYSEGASILYVSYLRERRELSRSRGPLFLSESRRNRAQPISIWTWSKVVEGIAKRAGVFPFTTHTLRHLCLTDLARCGWDIHEIATFAGHRNVDTTMQYIHLSGRDLANKLEKSMESIHAWRAKLIADVFANG